LRNGNHINGYLQKAFDKYGEFNFMFECSIDMSLFTKEEIFQKEESLITLHYDSKLLYNTLLKGWERITKKNGESVIERIKKPARKVCQFDKNYNLLATYDSIEDASKKLNCHPRKIYKSVQSKTECIRQYQWILESDYLENPKIRLTPIPINARNCFKICLLDDKQIINIFESLSVAAKELNTSEATLRRICYGVKTKKSADLKVMYLEDFYSEQFQTAFA
jgi:hypothetical protein